MKSTNVLMLGIVTATVLCSTVRARNIVVDDWQATGPVGTTSLVTVDPANLPLGVSLTGITSLSFSPGNDVTEYQAATLDQTPFGGTQHIEYAFGTADSPPNTTTPEEQIVIDPASPGAASTFSIEFNYAPAGQFGYTQDSGGPGETASLTVNGITYTATDPTALNDTTGILTFTNGVLQDPQAYAGAWTISSGGTVSAPEIDPSSAGSALTLLLGGIAVLRSARPRSSAASSR